jgi:serine/threonine protein kinase
MLAVFVIIPGFNVMSNVFQLKCEKCSREYNAGSIVPGNMPECECGGALQAIGQLIFCCDACNTESDPVAISLKNPALCPSCGMSIVPIRQIFDNIPATSAKTPELPVGSSDKTIGLAIERKSLAANKTGGIVQNNFVKMPQSAGAAPLEDKTVVLSNASIEELGKYSASRSGGGKSSIFGKYQILNEIARGGMGIVYKIYDPNLKRELALKLMIQGESATEVAIKRFLLEARAAANLKHPNIIAVHEMGELDGQFYFTMDFIEGNSFQDIFLSPRKMPEKVFIQHMASVCSALQAAHDQGIIHRDLKPANIMLEKQTSRVVLMDFGLAKDTSSMSIQSITGAVFGSPAYMSPEQAQGQTHSIDNRCDIYSMGVILYEGLTGKKPFYGETAFETISLVVNTEPVRPHAIAPGAVPRDMENIILKCLEKDPDRRYQHIIDLRSDLLSYLKGDPVSARPIPAHMRLWRKIRRNPAALGSVLASPLVVAAIIAGWLFFSSPSYLEVAADTIKSGDPIRQIGAVKDLSARLEQQKIKKPEQREIAFSLFRKCYSGSPEAVAAAIAASVKFGDEKAIPDLLAIAVNPETANENRAAALTAAGIIENVKKTGMQEYSRKITDIAADAKAPVSVRIEAAKALKFFVGPNVIPALFSIAENRNLTPSLRIAAIETLSEKISLINPLMKNMLGLYADESREVAQAAAKALAKIREPNQVLSFYGIKEAVGRAYGKIADIKQKEAERNKIMMELIDDTPDSARQKQATPLEAMLKKLQSHDAGERAAAAYDLGQLGEGGAEPELVKSLTDRENNVRRVSARSIVLLAPKQAPDLIYIRRLLRNPESLIREQAVFILGELQDKKSVPDLIALARQEDSPRVQTELAKALSRAGDATVIPALEDIFNRSKENSASTALASLKAMSRFEKPAIPFLINSLETKDRELNSAAAAYLKEITGEDFGSNKQQWTEWLKKQK